jgi:glucose-1-phosphatase
MKRHLAKTILVVAVLSMLVFGVVVYNQAQAGVGMGMVAVNVLAGPPSQAALSPASGAEGEGKHAGCSGGGEEGCSSGCGVERMLKTPDKAEANKTKAKKAQADKEEASKAAAGKESTTNAAIEKAPAACAESAGEACDTGCAVTCATEAAGKKTGDKAGATAAK